MKQASTQPVGRLVATHDAAWTALEPGVDYVLLKADADGITTLTRFAAGTIGGWHTHPGGEELFVISGQAKIGGRILSAGDYVETQPNERHRVEALVDTLLFVRLPQLPIYDIVSPDEEQEDIA